MPMPSLLTPGATIGILSPSSPLPEGGLDKAIEWIEKQKYQVKLAPSVYAHDRFLAGSDEARAKDINDFFADPEIDAVFASRGGYGTPRLLDKINYDLIRDNPKPFVGLSDTTALQNAFLAKSGLISFSGFMPYLDAKTGQPPPVTEFSLWAALMHEEQSFAGEILFPGNISGCLIGGCLSLVVCLAGTPYMPEATGNILILEDIGEEPYRVDRMMAHLEQTGLFEQIGGIVFGEFYRCVSSDPEDGTIDEVMDEWAARIGKPALKNIPYGHQPNHCVISLGGQAVLKDGHLTFSGKE